MNTLHPLLTPERGFWLLLSATGLLLLYLLSPMLTPFVMAMLLAYMGDPLADYLESKRLSRTMAVSLVFVVMSLIALGVLMVLLPLLQQQLTLALQRAPEYLAFLHQQLQQLLLKFEIKLPDLDRSLLKNLFNSDELAARFSSLLRVMLQSGMAGLAVVGWLANLLLIPVVTFYLLRDWDILVARIYQLVPYRYQGVVGRLTREADAVLGRFIRGQLTVMALLGLFYALGLSLLGLELALLIGLFAGVLSFVPYLGVIAGVTFASIAALMQFHELTPLLGVVVVFTLGQLLEGMVLVPRLLGESIGLHPVMVIFAIMAGGQLFGFFGVLLALPVAAVAMVLLRYAHQRYRDSTLYVTAAVASEQPEE
ncbi:MAG: AI-2E family transporter [Gammaproteobacteria bacterium]|nr:AI-2E family transporter [Gammaproteobacteria bacterium]